MSIRWSSKYDAWDELWPDAAADGSKAEDQPEVSARAWIQLGRYLDLVGRTCPGPRTCGRLFYGASGSSLRQELQRGRLSLLLYNSSRPSAAKPLNL